MALISRYHRRSGPRRKHPEFAALSAADQAVVRRLSGVLRVADGLDRGHSASVKQVDVELAPEALRLRLTAADPGRRSGSGMLGRESEGRRAGQAAPPRHRDQRAVTASPRDR